MARHLRLRHREPHVGEEAALAALANVPLGIGIGLGTADPDGVEPEVLCQALQLRSGHGRIVAYDPAR